MPVGASLIMEFVAELIAFIAQLASGTLTIDAARKRAADLMQRKPEGLTDALLDELDAKIKALEPLDAEPVDVPDNTI